MLADLNLADSLTWYDLFYEMETNCVSIAVAWQQLQLLR